MTTIEHALSVNVYVISREIYQPFKARPSSKPRKKFIAILYHLLNLV